MSKYSVVDKEKNGCGLIITFKLPNGKLIKIDTNHYKKYGAPICGFNNKYMRVLAHMVEPDGNILLADANYFRRFFIKSIFDCKIHNKQYGCKYHLGSDCQEFQQRNLNCRCFAKIATQYDYDKYCHNMYKSGNTNFTDSDNSKVYKYLQNKKIYYILVHILIFI